MTTRNIETRLEIYSVEGPGSEIYVCIEGACSEAAVYKIPDPDLALFYCEADIPDVDIATVEWLGINVIA